jgi:DNA-binding NtrC family response regulator
MDKRDLKILMIDDEEPAFMMLSAGLSKYGFTVIWEGNPEKERVLGRIAKEKPDAIVLDILFNGRNEGRSLLQEIKKSRYKKTPVIMLTNTMKSYVAKDYPGAAFPFAKDAFRLGDRAFTDLSSQIRDVLEKDVLDKTDIAPNDERFGFIVGNTPAMIDVCRTILKVAPTDATVLITGESGTGKETVARALQSLSLRKDKPLISINCAALPDENLLISTLFGHEKGAFTGAAELRKGIFETASGGTVFLDEIGDAPPQVQDKLLRALREREIFRLGSSVPIKVDIRVLCATNKNLEHEMDAGKFRMDLYQRISVIKIHLPPLRERSDDDLEMLYTFFVNKFNTRYSKAILGSYMNDELRKAFREYSWPGNIAEFESKIESAVINVTRGNVLLFNHFSFEKKQGGDIIVSNTKDIIQKIWDGKLKWSHIKDEFAKSSSKRTEIMKGLVNKWLEEKGLRPKHGDIANLLATTERNIQQKFRECELSLTKDWPKEKKVQ